MNDWLGLSGRRAVVTGAGSGIGQGSALALARVGVHVVAMDRDDAALATTLDMARAADLPIDGVACDVTDNVALRRSAAELPAMDILVNAAGIGRAGSLLDLDLHDWEAVLAVNLTGCLTTTQAFAPAMVERGGGCLIHIASISARHPQPGSGAYSASKSAVSIMSQQLAFELGPAGVRSNSVSPGLVRTPMTEAYYRVDGVAERRDAAVPMGRVARADDIADVVVFLASDRARYVTGADITVDGGFSTRLMGTVPRPGFDG